MTLPIQGDAALVLALVFGGIFGMLLERGRVANYDVIVNQFRLRDFTVVRVMLTAVVVGGVGVLVLNRIGLSQYHIKPANLVAVASGAALFGIGMVLYGYCPGTGVAAIGTGSIHAIIGFLGMIIGGILYALSYSWVEQNILSLAAFGKVRLPDVTGVPDTVWFLALAVIAVLLFRFLDRREDACRI